MEFRAHCQLADLFIWGWHLGLRSISVSADNFTLPLEGKRGLAHTQRVWGHVQFSKECLSPEWLVIHFLKGCIITGPILYTELEQEPKMAVLQILSHHWYLLTLLLFPVLPHPTYKAPLLLPRTHLFKATEAAAAILDFADGKDSTSH